ncbi:MAG: glycosyltransferase family 61 protein [Cyclobacteriaceae bacterium]|jgi:hypothetical protein|nr:glycosyltransferase family 61 protein [Cyclobacteriaceae bacterium]
MVKRVLKNIFPTAFLKHAFYLYNSLKVKTIDLILFPEYKIERDKFHLYRKEFPFILNKVSIQGISNKTVQQYMLAWKDWTQEEYIYFHKGKITIEPKIGWGIVERNKILYYSLGISRTLFLPKPEVFTWFLGKKKIKEVDKIISLRDTGEENYFHFFNDVLAKIYFLELQSIPVQEYQLLIAEKVWNKNFFQFWLTHIGHKKNFIWLVQKSDEYIISKESIFCKPITHHLKVLENLFQPYSEIPIQSKSYPEKIYLKRNPKRLRFVENADEIESLVMQYGFEVIDTDELCVADQIGLFKEVKKVIGIHGAGLTNLFFSINCTDLIELFPPPDAGYLPFHYIMVASFKNIRYDALIGDPTKNKYSGAFLVNKKELESLIINHQ